MSARLLLVVSAAAVLLSSCWLTPQDRDCYGGLELNGLYEIRVIEQWSPDSQFRWRPNIEDVVVPYPRCNGVDGLVAGTTFRVRLAQRRYPPGDTSCHIYMGVPVDGIDGVDFTSTPRMLDGPFSIQVFTPGGFYKMSTWSELANHVGMHAQPGQPPPLGLMRETNACVDLFAAEMHRVPDPVDASIDAGSAEAGGVDP